MATASDVLAMVAEQGEIVMNDEKLGTVERARTIGFLAGTLLKAIEVANLSGRPWSQVGQGAAYLENRNAAPARYDS